ncbi:MAG: hypothetical protein ACYTFV_01705 [Planctomycetota bacterium]|jgi:hypothetical protein
MSTINTDQVSLYLFRRQLDGHSVLTYAAEPVLPEACESEDWQGLGARLQLWRESAPGRVALTLAHNENDHSTRLRQAQGGERVVGYASARFDGAAQQGVGLFVFPQLMDQPCRFLIPSELAGLADQELWVSDPDDLRHLGLTAGEVGRARLSTCEFIVPRIVRARLFGEGLQDPEPTYILETNDPVGGAFGEANFYPGETALMYLTLPQPELKFDLADPITITPDDENEDVSAIYTILPESNHSELWVVWNFPFHAEDRGYGYFLNIDIDGVQHEVDPKIYNRAKQIPPQPQSPPQ